MPINGERLKENLLALAALARTDGGINRLTYSDAFWRSCDFVEEIIRFAQDHLDEIWKNSEDF